MSDTDADDFPQHLNTDLPEPWCTDTCPRQQTHMMSDCECGGATREFTYLREQRRANRGHRPWRR